MKLSLAFKCCFQEIGPKTMGKVLRADVLYSLPKSLLSDDPLMMSSGLSTVFWANCY